MTTIKLGQLTLKKTKIANALTEKLLAIESRLFEKNGMGRPSYIKDIRLFSSSQKDINFQSQDVEKLAIFCKEVKILDAERAQLTIDNSKNVDISRYFEAFKQNIAPENLTNMLVQYGFGFNCFMEFDYAHKDGERAIAYIEMYGELPNYEVTEIAERNELIGSISQELLSCFSNKGAITSITHYLLTSSYSDTSNSDFAIHFFVSNGYILVIHTPCDV